MTREDFAGIRSALLDLVFPRNCTTCNTRMIDDDGHLCWDCRASAEYVLDPFCSRCGDPADGEIRHDYVCSFCRRRTIWFDSARSAVRYRGPFRESIQQFKYNRATHLSTDFAPFLRACVETHFPRHRFDGITIVPMHPRKERERCYNQAALLGAGLAAELAVSYRPRCLRRVKDVRSQTRLTARQRAANVRAAFAVNHQGWIEGRRWLLVDDVMSTGATVNECARVLKQAGAASVSVVTLARG